MLSLLKRNRDLDDCTELLSLIGKIAARFGWDFAAAVVLAAVDDIETRTTGPARKICQ